MENTPPVTCIICGQSTLPTHATPVRALRPSLRMHVEERQRGPLNEDDEICRRCLHQSIHEHLLARLQLERGALSYLEKEVAQKAASHETVAKDLFATFHGSTTLGERLADGVARIGGSWRFVLGFGVFLGLWMMMNAGMKPFDPYPYILLNLVLSTLAALQAPIIMMSQNRATARDRLQADHDFRINLKAELEVATLHEKIDHLLHEQWESMLELQEAQLELLNEIRKDMGPGGAPPPSSAR